MRTRTAIWFECKIRYDKVMENGQMKKVTELYCLDALSYTEAEKRIIKEVSQYISGDFEVADIKKAAYKEVFFDDADSGSDRYYRAKLDFITIDEKTEKEKRSRVTFLVQAGSFGTAYRNVQDAMSGTMTDYCVNAISETTLMDVFEYREDDDKEDGQ